MLTNPWFALAAWLLSYAADYYLTIYSARLYRESAQAFITFEGSFELTPYYQKDIDALRRVSPRFLLAVVWSVLLLELMWYFSVVVLKVPELFQVLLGGLVLREAAVLLRHDPARLDRATSRCSAPCAAGRGCKGNCSMPAG